MISSGTMTGEKADPSKVDSTPVDIKYKDIPEERRKQFEAAFQKGQEEAKKRLLACFGMTRQGLFEKEKFIAHIRAATAEPIYYDYSCCFICFHSKRCKFYIQFH